jgi:hypothetical protein
MKVSSPIGDLPLELNRLSWKEGVFVVEGTMGAWPARIIIYPRDAPMLIRVVRWPLALLGIAIIALIVIGSVI